MFSPAAYAGKKLAAPPFAVFEGWESMLRAGMRVGRALGHVSVAVRCPRASLRDAVEVWGCAFPPVNWRAIFIGPCGTL